MTEREPRNGRSIPMSWMLGIAGALIAGGIVTSISFSISVSRDLGTTSARLANLESGASTPMANVTRERFDGLSTRITDSIADAQESRKSINEHLIAIDLKLAGVSDRLARIETRR